MNAECFNEPALLATHHSEDINLIDVRRRFINIHKRCMELLYDILSMDEEEQLIFPEIISVLLKCLPLPRLGVSHVPLVISGLENPQDLIEINLKKDNIALLTS